PLHFIAGRNRARLRRLTVPGQDLPARPGLAHSFCSTVQQELSWRCGMAGFSQGSLFIACGHATARRCSLTKAHQA
ncbi:TPA: hypothetical protein ACPYY3_005429, partial [Klebsiella oxytoca]|uniref:hypothetical protein n=2 Tax=Klebsiella oxytoca TaxID=571 RepID=UPI002449716D